MEITEAVISKEYLDEASCSVISQIAKEVILCVNRRDGIICAFDQHACHERVRLELLEKEVYDGAGRHSCPVHMELPWNLDDDLSASDSSSPLSDKKIAAQLARWGVTYQLHPNTSKVVVTTLPAFFYWSPTRPTVAAVQKFLASLVREIGSAASIHQLDQPSTVHDFLATRACRGAIMFGTPIRRADAALLIAQLRRTALPFQCAHGRPSVVPLVRLTPGKPRTRQHMSLALPRRFCGEWACSAPSLSILKPTSPMRPVAVKVEEEVRTR